jgi:hypothetical protein
MLNESTKSILTEYPPQCKLLPVTNADARIINTKRKRKRKT